MADNNSNESNHDDDEALKNKLKEQDADETIMDQAKKEALTASTTPPPTDLERGTTIGSMDAADIPIPTTLQRNDQNTGPASRPGAFARLGPGITVAPSSAGVPQAQHNTVSDILVTAQLVIEDDDDDDVETGNDKTAAVARNTPLPIKATVAEEADGIMAPHKTTALFWTRRNTCIVAGITFVVLGVILYLAIALATAGGDGGTAVAFAGATETPSDSPHDSATAPPFSSTTATAVQSTSGVATAVQPTSSVEDEPSDEYDEDEDD